MVKNLDTPNSTSPVSSPQKQWNAEAALALLAVVAQWDTGCLAIGCRQVPSAHESTLREYRQSYPFGLRSCHQFTLQSLASRCLAEVLTLACGWYFSSGKVACRELRLDGRSDHGVLDDAVLSAGLGSAKFAKRLESINDAFDRGSVLPLHLRLIPAVPFFVINASWD